MITDSFGKAHRSAARTGDQWGLPTRRQFRQCCGHVSPDIRVARASERLDEVHPQPLYVHHDHPFRSTGVVTSLQSDWSPVDPNCRRVTCGPMRGDTVRAVRR
jgi:hypothetical protein